MAAASRWFLVERGREKPNQPSAMPHNSAPSVNEKTHHHYPISPPYQGHPDTRKSAMNPVHMNMASQPARPNMAQQPVHPSIPKQPAHSNLMKSKAQGNEIPKPTHSDMTKLSNQRPADTAKMQNAIQEHYRRSTSFIAHPVHVNGDVYRPPAKPHINSEEHQPKIISQSNKVPSGTLKFMVSHSKKTMKKSITSPESNSAQQIILPPKQPTKKSSQVQESNSTQRIIAVLKQPSKNTSPMQESNSPQQITTPPKQQEHKHQLVGKNKKLCERKMG